MIYEFLLWLATFFAPVVAPPPVTYGEQPKKDYIGLVAAEAAYAATLPAAAPEKPVVPPDPNCKTCKGTGKVKSGDGLGWSKCPTCQPMTSGSASQMQISKPTRMPLQAN